ncbi:MAG: ComF family protein [Alistipes sp.]|nr:ComF family protein [Alistipes sp.]
MWTRYDIERFCREFTRAVRITIGFLERCRACDTLLVDGEDYVCTRCRMEAPITYLWKEQNNQMEQKFWGLLPIERAAAMFWYIKGSAWQRFIHGLKYHEITYHGGKLGRWFGAELMRSNWLDGIDLIITVPLHWSKSFKRGYNQSEYLANGISRESGIPCKFNTIRRYRNNPSQTTQSFGQRWENASNLFEVTHPELLRSKHILLVDDVFTTGATITSCAESIFKACEGDVRISIATLAISSNAFSRD